MKFNEMKYERISLEKMTEDYKKYIEAYKKAKTYKEARKVYIEVDTFARHVQTMATLCSIRHSINTNDEYYTNEYNYWNESMPQLAAYDKAWDKLLLESSFRKDFEKEFGNVSFLNAEIGLKTFSEEIIPLLQKENKLSDEYETLLAKAQVEFEGKKYTIPQMTPFKQDLDEKRRHAAWCAEGKWYNDNQEKLDSLYDDLVKVRTEMAHKLGYKNYVQLGYYNMERNCYDRNDVEKFRNAVVKYLVPIADKIYKEQAKRMNVSYPMQYSDMSVEFKSGNPNPIGTPEEILKTGQEFYSWLSPETKEFFDTMMNQELLDVLSKEGKQGGGYCTGIPDYNVPFIFANFNGTAGDVDVVTHEAGHAFECYLNRNRVPISTIWPSMEACEVHSMSMEFFAEAFADKFFGKDGGRKYCYSHLAGAVTFIPYGSLVDHFQHEVYDHPEYSPKQRHEVWAKLQNMYMPWVKLDGNIPFYAEGKAWQRQHHIYSSPFYYIDYCLAQTVALEFWKLIKEDRNNAWKHYMAYTSLGGSKVFTELLKGAELVSPFDEECLRGICEKASEFLDNYDLTGIE